MTVGLQFVSNWERKQKWTKADILFNPLAKAVNWPHPSNALAHHARVHCQVFPRQQDSLANHLHQFHASVQFSRSVVSDSAIPWTAACQASLSITNSQSLLKLMAIESVIPPLEKCEGVLSAPNQRINPIGQLSLVWPAALSLLSNLLCRACSKETEELARKQLLSSVPGWTSYYVPKVKPLPSLFSAAVYLFRLLFMARFILELGVLLYLWVFEPGI